MKARIASLTLVLSGVLAYLHFRALEESWYWFFSWFDNLMHFLGGVCIALFVSYIVLVIKGSLSKDEYFQTALIIGGTFLIGVFWEVFEHVFNISFEPLQSIDTVTDLLMDTLGAFAVSIVLDFFIDDKRNNHE